MSDNEEQKEESKSSERPYIVLLDKAVLETVKTKRGTFELLNCDDHRNLAGKIKKDPATLRPDILHQELLALLDSPLNKAGKLKVYINTTKNVLIDVNPAIRIPRTFKRFAGLMVQLLHKLKIRSTNGSDTLLRVIKAPYTRHLPADCHTYVFSVTGTLYNPNQFAGQLPAGKPCCFVIGAMASGHIREEDHPQTVEKVSLSEYPLSGATAINRLMGALETQHGIF